MRVPKNGFSAQVVNAEGDYTVLRLAGELDLVSAPQLNQTLTRLIDDHRCWLVLDFSRVTFCDSCGFNALLAALGRAQERGGTIRLVGLQPPVLRAFRLIGLTRMIPIYDSLADAVQQ